MTIASMAQNSLVTSCSIDPKRKEREKEKTKTHQNRKVTQEILGNL